MSQITVMIPTLNEAESIRHVVAEMPWPQIVECIVVEKGSTGRTAELAHAAGARLILQVLLRTGLSRSPPAN